MLAGIAYAFMEFVVGHEANEVTNYRRPIGALTTVDYLFIFLILLRMFWSVFTRIRMTPSKSFLYQTTHSKDMIENRAGPCNVYH